jgi:hypothetical protein
MSNHNVLELVKKYSAAQTSLNQQFQEQRVQLSKFYEYFSNKLRKILLEMESDQFTLKERNFDPGMLRLLAHMIGTLTSIKHELNEGKPYIAAQKLVEYIMGHTGRSIIENLEFLSQHHLKNTSIDLKPHSLLKEPEIHSFKQLQSLANYLKIYMIGHPLVTAPSEPPPAFLPPQEDIPAFFAGKEDKTVPGVPQAKKKL